MFCKYCGGRLERDEKFCTNCGRPTTEETTDSKTAQKDFCPRCGQALQEGKETCPVCGHPVGADDGPTAFRSAPYQNQQPYVEKKGTTIGVIGLVLAFILAPFDLILGIIAIVQGKKTANKTAVVLGICAIVLNILLFILQIFYFLFIISLLVVVM